MATRAPSVWKTQPTLGSRLQYGHPLASMLYIAAAFNEGAGLPHDLGLQDNRPFTAIGGPTWAPRHNGSARKFNSSGIYDYIYDTAANPSGGDFSAMVIVDVVTPSDTQGLVSSAQFAADSNPNFLAYLSRNTSGVISWLANSSAYFIGSIVLGAGRPTVLTVTFDSANKWKFYVDGVLDASTTSYGNDTGNRESFFPGSGFPNTMTGYLSGAYWWRRGLSPTEVAWLAAEPYAMWAPPAPYRRWFLNSTAGAPATSKPYYYALTQGLGR